MFTALQKKSQMCIPKEFETFHVTHAAVDVLGKMEELNSELHFRLYYCLFKKKIIKIDNCFIDFIYQSSYKPISNY